MNLRQLRFRVSGNWERPSLLWAAARLAAFSLALPLLALGSPQEKPEPSNPPSESAVPVQIPAAVQHVKLLLDNGSPALEILTTAPVTPRISKVNSGTRLLIDLPNTSMSVPGKALPIKNPDLSALRLNRSNTTPPLVHVEVDFRRPLGYTWDSTGNRLLISFHDPNKEDTSAPVAAGTALPVSAPADVANFAHVVSAEQVAPGASVTAGSETTVLRLKRAGDVYVCPQTSVSVVHSKNGPDFMLAMNDGGLETHLALKNSADEVVTPDFRILLRGPGEFHYAIRSDSRGNTCVRTLPGNTASAIIYELLGDGTYNVQAGDQLVFHEGKLSPDAASHAVSTSSGHPVLPLECGCPPPARSVTLLASNRAEPRITVEDASPASSTPAAGRPDITPDPDPSLAKNLVASGSPVSPEAAAEIRELPESLPNQPHVQVEASLTFRPDPVRMAASHLPASSRQLSSPVTALPPSPAPEPHKTVLGKIKSFFSRVF